MTSTRSSRDDLRARLDAGPVICAEGFLFELERRGYLTAGEFVPEVALEHPGALEALHRDYQRAGSDIVEAFTYNGHREKMRVIGKESLLEPLNRAALQIARRVADSRPGDLMAGNISNTNIWNPDDQSAQAGVRSICPLLVVSVGVPMAASSNSASASRSAAEGSAFGGWFRSGSKIRLSWDGLAGSTARAAALDVRPARLRRDGYRPTAGRARCPAEAGLGPPEGTGSPANRVILWISSIRGGRRCPDIAHHRRLSTHIGWARSIRAPSGAKPLRAIGD